MKPWAKEVPEDMGGMQLGTASLLWTWQLKPAGKSADPKIDSAIVGLIEPINYEESALTERRRKVYVDFCLSVYLWILK